jgi:hypothetical protein
VLNAFRVVKDGKIRYPYKCQQVIFLLEKRWYRERSSIRPFSDEWGFLFCFKQEENRNGTKRTNNADKV